MQSRRTLSIFHAILSLCVFFAAQGKAAPDVQNECTAESPKEGFLDSKSPLYSGYKITKEPQEIRESARMKVGKETIEITTSIGGCAHYHATYAFVFADQKPITDLKHYIERSLVFLKAIHAPKDKGYHRLIVENLEKALKKGDDLKSRTIAVVAGYSHVFWEVEKVDSDQVKTSFSYDIAL